VSGTTVDVVYDGLCLLCRRSIRVLRAVDIRRRLVYHDANERAAVSQRFPVLRDVDLDAAMYAVDDRGRAYRGFYAFRRIAWTTPAGWWLLPLLYFPGVSAVGERAYETVARNRSRMGCRVGELDRDA
jgi:predicted DCC family thiol-disulfide oxidoreductase YuxK